MGQRAMVRERHLIRSRKISKVPSFQIDLFIRQQREKEAEEQRVKNAESSPFRNQRPNSLELDRAAAQMSLVRSTSLNIQLSSIDNPIQQNSPDGGSNPSPTGTETEDIRLPGPNLGSKECTLDHNHIYQGSFETPSVDGPSEIATSHSQTVTAV